MILYDSEKAFFGLLCREYKVLFPKLGNRTRFNRTKRNLYAVIREIREHISLFIQRQSINIRVIDSMQIPVYEFGRAHFSKCFKDEAFYGRGLSKKETYFGFKFHAPTTVDGFLTDYVITPANIDYRNVVWDLCDKYNSISIIGDKGYINKRLMLDLKSKININKVKSKSMLGFITRTSIKVLAHNILFLINKLMGNDDSMVKIKRLVIG